MNGNRNGDMIRANANVPPHGLTNQSFMQNPPPMGQQLLAPNQMGIPPGTPPMAMVSGPNGQLRYLPQQQGQQQQQQRNFMRQNTQPLNPTAGSTPAHMSSLIAAGQVNFGGNMIPPGSNTVRRVISQPHINPSAHMPQGASPMVMNPRQQHQTQLQRQQQQMAMSPDMSMMMRQGGPPGMPHNLTRAPPAQAQQVMNSLTHPPSMNQVSHPAGMQQSHLQSAFSNGMPLQHQPPSSPRPNSLPPNHAASMSISTPGPSHTPVNRTRMTPDNANQMQMAMNFQASQGSNSQRIPQAPGQYPFDSSSTPPLPLDISQPIPSGMMNTQGNTPNRSFHPTPAQQFEQMKDMSDPYGNHFTMPPPSVPSRPPSHNNPHPLQQQQQPSQQSPHRQSPLQPDQMSMHPQRPQSQPQSQPPGRPPSQTGLTHRSSHSALSNQGLTATGRLPLAQQGGSQLGHPPQGSGSSQHLPIAPRPPPPPSAVPIPSTTIPTSQPPTDAPPATNPPRSEAAPLPLALGNGQGLIRLLQFSGNLSSENPKKLQLSWWNDLVKEYFTPKAVMKLTLWKDNEKAEAKPFEIGVPILPRFFLVTTQSGVKSMTLSLDGARERIYSQGHAVVECVTAVWTYKYSNGYTVTLRGPLTAHVVIASTQSSSSQLTAAQASYQLKFDHFQFDANHHDKSIALDSIVGQRQFEAPKIRHVVSPTPGGSSMQQQQREEDKKWEEPRVVIEHGFLPGEPVNAFGIPQATMRCLELAESVGAMGDLMNFSNENQLGPLEALSKFASKLRETYPIPPFPLVNGLAYGGVMPHPFQPFPAPVNGGTTTLYSSAPPSITNPTSAAQPSPQMNSPQNTSSSSTANSPQKQHKTIPPPAQTSGTASSPAVSSGATMNTPALSSASLKRKQADASSPAPAAPDPPSKRATRKRGRTTTGPG